MTILISGATGFLGSYLLKSFIRSGYKVIALKRSTSNDYRIKDCLKKCRYYDIDRIDIKSIFKKHKINFVINTVTNYGRKDTNILSIVDTNLVFGLKLLQESVSHNIEAYINTDTLLDKNVNSYTLSKSQLVDWMKILSTQNTKMINIKIEHIYGALDDENKFIYWIINQLRGNVERIDLTSGIQKRDFVYISDVVSAYKLVILNIDKINNYEEFELGNGKSIKVKTFLNMLFKELSKTQAIQTVLNFGAIDYRDNENMNMIADITKLKKLGWKTEISIQEGISRILNTDNYD
jgi:CDP-paratose synthetase